MSIAYKKYRGLFYIGCKTVFVCELYNIYMKNFVKTLIKPIISVTAFYTVHYFNYGRQFCFEGEKHDFWELVYVDRGCITITADNKQFELYKGQASFTNPINSTR